MTDTNDTNDNSNTDKVVAQNEANAAAGLPPVSTNLRTPTPVPEESLSPIYPKMTEIVDAMEHGNPIPVSEAVEELEKPSPDGSDTMRKLMDTVQEDGALEGGPAYTPELTPGVVAMRDIIEKTRVAEEDPADDAANVSAANVSAVNAATSAATATIASNTAIAATTTANTAFASIGKLKRHVRDLRIGFVVLTVVLVGDLISHFVA
jgi:hypothetical protein